MTSPAPHWERIHFAVSCARCGRDLRGLTDPRCPDCDLDFDWAEAVPLDKLTCLNCGYHLFGLEQPRCPECGRDFTWEGVLDDYRRRKKPLFEYHWRRQPVRAFCRAWWLSWRPWRLWRHIDIHDPPAVPGLLVLLLLSATVFVVSLPLLVWIGTWAIEWLEGAIWGGPQPTALGWRTSTGAWRRVPGERQGPWGWPLAWYGNWLKFIGAAFTAGFCALLLLRQSMARAKVKARHVLRVYVYAALPLAAGHALYCAAAFALDVAVLYRPSLGMGAIGDQLRAGIVGVDDCVLIAGLQPLSTDQTWLGRRRCYPVDCTLLRYHDDDNRRLVSIPMM
ncbi:MAG: hypothetical protein IID40_12600 [Planctomycetes bacterium]|nr:hypothetical protein [Planctomycetota bacterium]